MIDPPVVPCRSARRSVLLLVVFLGLPVLADVDLGNRGPEIRFESTTHDFGRLRSDQGKVRYAWTYRNVGDEPLEIVATRPSCGCTATAVSEQKIPPGAEGVLEVTFDPSGQHGSVRKSLAVTTNASSSATVLLTIKAWVEEVEPAIEPGGHPPVTGQSLLAGSCADCHAAPAAGKSGKALYEAVCAMCHGGEGRGASGPGLRDPRFLTSRSDDDLTVGITYGTANPSMPGFSGLMGGPLDEAQIRSLVRLIRSWEGAPRQDPDERD